MGLRGKQPVPTPILNARGSWRGKARAGEPKPPVERPKPPAWLKGEARSEWDKQIENLHRMGLLARCDGAVLAAYCEAWADFVHALWCIEHGEDGRGKNAGKVVDGSMGNPVISPWVRIKEAAVQRLLKFADRFGFSPAARARVRAEAEQPGSADKGRFFGEVG